MTEKDFGGMGLAGTSPSMTSASTDDISITAPVNKIIPFSCVDGPGNRTAVFLQGCNQNCLYCHNPETINLCRNCGACVNTCPAGALSLVDGIVSYDYKACCNCDTCLKTCTFDASPKIRNMTPAQLYDEVKAYFPFISGITTSGGECSLYLDFLREFYTLVKNAGKTTYMDTNGQVPLWDRMDLLEVTDKTMIDLKAGSTKGHMKLTGRELEVPVENIRRMAAMGKLYEIRTVVVPDAVDNLRTIELGSSLIAPYPQVRYKLIKFRHYGVRPSFSATKEPSDEMMEKLKERVKELGIKEIVVT